ncbi:MAG TPA: hypothetical protein VIY52_18350 [Streptosporangiaceae bacterium]
MDHGQTPPVHDRSHQAAAGSAGHRGQAEPRSRSGLHRPGDPLAGGRNCSPTAWSSDVRERGYWDDYQVAFEEMLSQTSTKWAPWYVVPADHKWFSRLATAAVLVTALSAIDPKYPAADPAVRDQMAQVRDDLAAELARGASTASARSAAQAGRSSVEAEHV